MIVIDAPFFYCGVILKDGKVQWAAPIVKFMRGWTELAVTDYCRKRWWKYEVMD